MKVVLTGASSFTGFWFAKELAAAGHHVVAPLLGSRAGYTGTRGQRVEHLARIAEVAEECPFGSERFLQVLATAKAPVLCHHAANVTNYRSVDFDVVNAVQDNTRNLREVLRLGRENGLAAVVLTGTVFEQNEGAGSEMERAFSPYGLSKGLSTDIFRFRCHEASLPLVKFVIPNPFGPYEEPRFCAYLMGNWTQGRPAQVRTPAYIRDNIPVSLLAKCYAQVASRLEGLPAFSRFGPMGYVESQGDFARRFAREIGSRLGLDTPLELADQTDFSEPMIRVNTDSHHQLGVSWDESQAWDELAGFYADAYGLAGR